MSDRPATSRGGVQSLATGLGRSATQGMISPGDAFVDGNGALTGIAYRFLHAVFFMGNGAALLGTQVASLQATCEDLRARLAAVEARLPSS